MLKNHSAFRLNALLVLFLSVLFSLCTKHDTAPVNAGDKLEQAFFQVGPQADPLLQVVANKLRAINQQHPFVNRIAQQAGMPQWQQDMRVAGERNELMGIQSKTARNTKAHFIPFIKEGARRISALLMVKVSGTDTTYKMIYRQHYRNYGFTERPGKWNARTVMLLFAMMEEQVFDYKNFLVNDGRIMGGKIGERFRISFEPDATSSDPNNQRSGLVTTCKNYKSCFTVGGPYICANRTVCKTEFVYDQPEEVQSFLDDDTGADIPGGDTTFILVEPCPDQNTSTQTGWQQPDDSFYAIDPCDETAGWEPEALVANQSIIDSLQGYPCAQDILSEMPSLNHEVEKILTQVFKTVSTVNILFKADEKLTKDHDDGYTKISRNSKSYFEATINLNPWVLNHSSKEYILVTMVHESVHAYIDYWHSRYQFGLIDSTDFKIMFPCFWEPNRPLSNTELQQHTEIVNNYLELMTRSIRSFNPMVSEQIARDLAFGGLQSTTVWSNRSDTNSIKQTNAYARDNIYNQFASLKLTKCP